MQGHQLDLERQMFALKPDGIPIIYRSLLSTHYSPDV